MDRPAPLTPDHAKAIEKLNELSSLMESMGFGFTAGGDPDSADRICALHIAAIEQVIRHHNEWTHMVRSATLHLVRPGPTMSAGIARFYDRLNDPPG
jgi:hypothetical protein